MYHNSVAAQKLFLAAPYDNFVSKYITGYKLGPYDLHFHAAPEKHNIT